MNLLNFSFSDFWNSTGGISGDFDYGTIHLVSAVILIVLTVVLSIICAKYKGKTARVILLTIAIFQLSFEIFWRVVYLTRGSTIADLWPLYVCNLNGILLPLAVLTNSKYLKKMFYTFGFIGGVLTFIMPQGIFNNAYLNFAILKSLLQHTSLILIPVIAYVSGDYRQKLKDYLWLIVGTLLHVLNSYGMGYILNRRGDYLFFNSGLPFTIPGIPQWIVLSVFALVVFALICMSLDPRGTKELFAKLFSKKYKKKREI